MKILLLTACALALQGCVTYSNPYEPTGRIQYVGQADYDEYGHDEGTPVADLRIADVGYYPWWSIDYYYLGNHYYRPAYLGNPYYSLGFSYGVPPYYWPYYGFYSPFYYPYASYAWYDPWYGWPRYGIGLDVPWLGLYWANRYRDFLGPRYQPVYSEFGNGHYENQLSPEEALTDPRDRAYPGEGLQRRSVGSPSQSVSLLPQAGTSDAGMEMRSARERKVLESRIGPAPVPSPSVTGPATPPIVMSPQVRSMPAQPSMPAASAPRMVRQMPVPQARPGPPPMPSAPSPPPAARDPGNLEPPRYSESGDRRRN